MTLLAALIFGGASLARVAMRLRVFPGTATIALLSGIGAGLLLAAPQLLPTLELLSKSVLAPIAPAASGAILPVEVHDSVIGAWNLLPAGISRGIPGLASPALALVAVLFAGVGRARSAVLLAIAAIALGVPIPGHTLLHELGGRLPMFGDVQFSFRSHLISTLAIAVGAGVGVSRIERRWGGLGVASAAGVALFAVALQLWPIVRFARQDGNSFPRERPRPSSGLFGRAGVKSALAQQIEVARRPEYKGSRSYWYGFGLDKLGEEENLLTLQDREPLELTTTSRLMDFLMPAGVGPIPDEPAHAALFDVMSVRLVVTDAPPAWLGKRMRRIDEVSTAPFAFENPHALPRAWRAVRSEAAPADPQAALARLVDPDFDVHTTVLLDAVPAELAGGKGKRDKSARTRIEVDQPEEVVIRTSGATPAVLVLNDSADPGWQATLDSVATPLLRANTAFRAVAVPAGEHVVRMLYRPRSLGIGLALAALTAAALVFAVLRERVQFADKPIPEREPEPAPPLEPEK